LSHQRIHSGERPYIYVMYVANYSNSNVLLRHQHIHSGERSYVCDVCSISFKHDSSLIVDRRMHSGEHPHIYMIDVANHSMIGLI
jgi:KRAB domain-containing zinc finger protein